MNRAIGGLLAAAGMLGACGGNEGGSGAGDFGDRLERAYCEWATRCNLVHDVDSCLASHAAPFDADQLVTVASGVEAGTVDYDADSAAACLALVDGLGCTVADIAELTRTHQMEDACAGAFAGTVADGAACTIDEECVSGQCLRAGCTEACCMGTCEPTVPDERVPIGGECASHADCVDGAYCRQEGPPSTCQPLIGEGGPCSSSDMCEVELVCVSDGVTSPACRVPAAQGESCAANVCGGLDDVCGAASTCVRRARPGEACGFPAVDCVAWANCVGGLCIAQGLAGTTCGGTSPSCLGDLLCVDGVCTEQVETPPCIIE